MSTLLYGMDAISLDAVRYGLTVVLIVILPVVIVFWLIIHGAISVWKARPAWQAYTAALAVILTTLTFIILNFEIAIGRDLGTSIPLLVAGTAIYIGSLRMSSRIRSHLSFRTFAGIPEVKSEAHELIEVGPFSIVRHPRYFMIVVGTVGWALAANYTGGYIVSGLFFLGLYLIMLMEERELTARFGSAYKDYQQRVPMVFPRLARIGQLFA
ncbi:MAG: isoprenylcysteine carboxylmethyltransferase family protein [Pseudomonadota bacterium]